MAEINDSTPLLPQIACGDAEAVNACLDRYGGLVWAVAVRLLGAGPDAEDAAQDTFIDVWRFAERFDAAKSRESTFITMIARRRCIDRLRRRVGGGVRAGLLADWGSVPAAAGRDVVEDRDELARVRSAMAELPPPRPEVVRLSVCDGLTHPQIAERLGLPLGTVKAHARRGLIALRESLGRGLTTAGRSIKPRVDGGGMP